MSSRERENSRGGTQRVPCLVEKSKSGAQEAPCLVENSRGGTQRVPCLVEKSKSGAQEAPCLVEKSKSGAQEAPCLVEKSRSGAREASCLVEKSRSGARGASCLDDKLELKAEKIASTVASVMKVKFADSAAERKRKLRSNKEYRSEEREKDKLHRREARAASKLALSSQDSIGLSELSISPAEKKRLRQEKLRSDPEYKKRELEKQRLKSMQVKEEQCNVDAVERPRRERKLNPRFKDYFMEKDKQYHRNLREDPIFRQKEHEVMKEKRSNAEYRDREALAKRESRLRECIERCNEHAHIPAEIDLASGSSEDRFKRLARAVKKYHDGLADGFREVCVCCSGTFRKCSIKFDGSYDDCVKRYGEQAVQRIYFRLDYDFKLCATCFNSLKANKVPQLCGKNGLEYRDLPEDVRMLNAVEEILVSPIIEYCVIIEHRSDNARWMKSYLHIRGSIINVPVNPFDMCRRVTTVPRMPEETKSVVTAIYKLKKHAEENRKPYARDEVDCGRVTRVLNYLKDQELYVESKVKIRDDQGIKEACDKFNAERVIKIEDDEFDEEFPDDEHPPQETAVLGLPAPQVNLYPGEGNKATSALFGDDLNELAYPSIFGAQRYPRRPGPGEKFEKVTRNAVVKYQMRNVDRSHRKNKYILARARQKLFKQLQSSKCTILRMSSGKNRPKVKDIFDPEQKFHKQQAKNDLIYTAFKDVPNTPQYWKNQQSRLKNLIRAIGPPTLFITISLSEWEEADLLRMLYFAEHKEDITNEEASALPSMEKIDLYTGDPVIVSRYFELRMSLLIDFMKNPDGPFGNKFSRFYSRVEYQHRGTPHAHMMVWLKDVPVFDKDDPSTFESVEQFIDQIITCEKDLINADVTRRQTHKHTSTCRRIKKGLKVCRFGYPIFPMDRTRVLLPLKLKCKPDSREMIKAQKDLKKIKDYLHNLWNYASTKNRIEDTPEDFESYLKILELNLTEYLDAIRSTMDGPAYFLRRRPQDIAINCFNVILALLINSNMDIQFILDPYACIKYLTDYIGKASLTASLAMRKIFDKYRKKSVPLDVILKEMARELFQAMEMGAPEAGLHCIGGRFVMSNFTTVSVQTNLPDQRTRIEKSRKKLDQDKPESDDTLCMDAYEKYEQRPLDLEDANFADFVTLYSKDYKEDRQSINNDDDDEEMPLHIEDLEGETIEKPVVVVDDPTFVVPAIKYRAVIKRKILQIYIPDIVKDKENHFRVLITFFGRPWRSEEDEILRPGNYEERYIQDEELIKKNKSNHYKLDDDVVVDWDKIFDKREDEIAEEERVALKASHIRPDLNIELSISVDDFEFEEFLLIKDLRKSEVDEQAEELITEDQSLLEKNAKLKYLGEDKERLDEVKSFLSYKKQTRVETDVLNNWIKSLNKEQYEYIVQFCKLVRTETPFYHVILGYAGTGKSFVIKLMLQLALKIFSSQSKIEDDELPVLLAAPSGTAAFLIGGLTLHSAFLLPTRKEYESLSASTLSTLQAKYRSTRVVFIDEISMCSNNYLEWMDDRLRQIKNCEEPFGGVSIVFFGDFNQLRPVAAAPIYKPVRHGNTFLWDLFEFFELTEIMRQKDDKKFAETLVRVADGNFNQQDIDLLKSRQCGKGTLDIESIPKNIIRLYALNRNVDLYNEKAISEIPGEDITSFAIDQVRIKAKINPDLALAKFHRDEKEQKGLNCGLNQKITLKIDAIYKITSNIDTSDGLVNGAAGALKYIGYARNEARKIKVPGIVFLLFDDQNIGKAARANFFASYKPISGVQNRVRGEWTPIKLKMVSIVKKEFLIDRIQLPLTPAHARTYHTSQGQTWNNVVCNLVPPGKIGREHIYVGLSRVTSLNGLYIIGDVEKALLEKCRRQPQLNKPNADKVDERGKPKKISASELDEIARNEIAKFKRERKLSTSTLSTVTLGPFSVMAYNIQSLKNGENELKNIVSLYNFNLIFLSETWLKPEDEVNLPGYCVVSRMDYVDDSKRGHRGMLCLARNDQSTIEVPVNQSSHELELMITKYGKNYIISVYLSPNQSWESLNKNFVEPMTVYIEKNGDESTKFIIIGDFNCRQGETNYKKLCEALAAYKIVPSLGDEEVTTKLATKIDHVFTNDSKLRAGTMESILSYHYPIYVSASTASNATSSLIKNLKRSHRSEMMAEEYRHLSPGRRAVPALKFKQESSSESESANSSEGESEEAMDVDMMHHDDSRVIPQKYTSLYFMLGEEIIDSHQIDILDSSSAWFDSNIINSYLFLLSQKYQDVFSTDTYLYQKLSGELKQSHPHLGSSMLSSRHPQADEMAQYRVVLIPIHDVNHWSLISVDMRSGCMTHYDSMHHFKDIISESIKRYFEFIYPSRRFEMKDQTNCPRQDNSNDCGAFVCKYAECIARSQFSLFGPSDMPRIRKSIKQSLLARNII